MLEEIRYKGEYLSIEALEKALGSDGAHMVLQIRIQDLEQSFNNLKEEIMRKYGEFAIRGFIGGKTNEGIQILVFVRKLMPLYIFENMMYWISDLKYVTGICILHIEELMRIAENQDKMQKEVKH